MPLYFNTREQINGDKAFNKKDYKGALKFYCQALDTLNQYVGRRNQSIDYPLAYVLGEIVQCKTLLLGQQDSSDNGFLHALVLEREINSELREARETASKIANPREKKEIEDRITAFQIELLKNTMVAYWNRALLLMAVDNEEQLITHLQSALEHIDTFIKQLNQLIELDEIDRPEDLNHALDLSVQVLDRLSDLFAEQGDNADSPLDERTKALKQAIVYSQKALAAQQELAPEETHINLHLTYLNLQDSLFQLTKDQVYLQQSSDYIRRYRLDGDFPTLVQLEIKAHQFSIARFLEPKQAREAQSIAQRIMTLGRVNDNPVLAEVYDSAETYLRASIPRPRDVFFAAPEREEGNHPNVGKRKHEDEGATQIDKKSKELSKLDILVEAAASAQRMF